MSKQLLNMASDHVADMMAATRDAMHTWQQTPIGTEPRSMQEEAALWRKMRLLPREHFNAVMGVVATRAGHQNDEKEPCEACSFVMRRVEGEAKKK